MSPTEAETQPMQAVDGADDRKRKLFAAGGVIGAILASTCCVVPQWCTVARYTPGSVTWNRLSMLPSSHTTVPVGWVYFKSISAPRQMKVSMTM